MWSRLLSIDISLVSLIYLLVFVNFIVKCGSNLNLTQEVFDFVVVGAGTAGSVVATRLSENGQFTVLLEAGPFPPFSTNAPLLYNDTRGDPRYDWLDRSVPQILSGFGYPNREIPISQGKMLGGCGSHNTMVYTRGNPRDYDRWAALSKDPRWGYANLQKYFWKIENYFGDKFSPADMGRDGPIQVSELKYNPLEEEWVRTGFDHGYPYINPNSPDQQSSFFPTPVLISEDGIRSSTFHAYLQPAMNEGRPNLVVRTGVLATKVVIDNTLRAVGVNYRKDSHGREFFAAATKEVILCAGAFLSPQLLLLSGIGDEGHLHSVGIQDVKVHLPGVGFNFHDHISTQLGPFVMNSTKASFIPSRDLTLETYREYFKTAGGPLASNMWTGMGLWSSTGDHSWPNVDFFQIVIGGRSISRAQPSLIQVQDYDYGLEDVDSLSVLVQNGRPLSRGWVVLRSNSALDPPLIQPNFYDVPEDMSTMVQALKFLVDFYESSRHFSKYGIYLIRRHFPGCEEFTLKSLGYYECFARHFTRTGHHPAGTCKMGADPTAVVDSQLQVYGVKGLRVADASIMPFITNTNPNTPTILIAEVVSDLILTKYDRRGKQV